VAHWFGGRGVATGGISVYTPPNQSTLNFLCGCFVSLTQDKFDIVQFIPTQIKFLATPLFGGMSANCKPRVESFADAGNGWPHGVLLYH